MTHMTIPLFIDKPDELYGVIQCMPNFKKDHKHAKGFTNADDAIMQVIATFFQLKM